MIKVEVVGSDEEKRQITTQVHLEFHSKKQFHFELSGLIKSLIMEKGIEVEDILSTLAVAFVTVGKEEALKDFCNLIQAIDLSELWDSLDE